MSEGFSFIKLIKSPFTGLYWIKVVMLGIGLFFIFGVGYTGYKAITKPTTKQDANSIINHYYQPNVHFGGCATLKELK